MVDGCAVVVAVVRVLDDVALGVVGPHRPRSLVGARRQRVGVGLPLARIGHRVTRRVVDLGRVLLAAERDDVALVVVRAGSPGALVRAARGVVVRRHRLRADRPDGDRAGDADEAAADAERVRLHVLRRQPEDADVAGRGHARAGTDVGGHARIGDADVDTARDADEAACGAARDGQRLEAVDGGDVDRPAVRVCGRAVADEGLRGDVEQRHADAAGDADEAAAGAGRQSEDVLARCALHGEAVEARRLESTGAGEVAVVHAVDRGTHRLRVHIAAGADERLRVLRHRSDADGDADTDVAARDARRDQHQLRVVGRGDEHVVARQDRHVGAGARERVDLEDGDAHRARDADLSAGRAGDHGDDRLLPGRDDRDVAAGGVHRRRVVDERVRVQRHEVDADTDADACGTGDRQRRRDAQLVVLVAGRDLDVPTRVDHGRLADVGRRVRRHDLDRTGQVDGRGTGEAGADADGGDVVAVRRGHRDAAERCRRRRDHAGAGLARIAGRRVSALDDAVRRAGAGARQVDDRAALRRGQLERRRVRCRGDAFRVVRLAVDESADRLSVTRAVEHLVVVRQAAAERVRQRDRVRARVHVDAVLRVESRRRVLADAALVGRDEAMRLATVGRARCREPTDDDAAAGQDAAVGGEAARRGQQLDLRRSHDVDVIDLVLVAVGLDAVETADARAAAVVVDDPLVLTEAADEVRVEGEDAVAGQDSRSRRVEARVDLRDREGAGADGQPTRGARGHVRTVADERVRVLGDDRDRRGGADGRRARGRDVAADHVHPERLGGRDPDTAAGADDRAAADVRVGRDVEDRDADVDVHGRGAGEAAADGDRRERLARGRVHGRVAGERRGVGAGEPGLGVLAHDLDVDARADTGGAADGERAGDAEDRRRIRRRDGEAGARAGAGDDDVVVEMGLRAVVHHVDDDRAGHADRVAAGAADRDVRPVLALRRGDADAHGAARRDVRALVDGRVDGAVADEHDNRRADARAAAADRDVAGGERQVGSVGGADADVAAGAHGRAVVDVRGSRVRSGLVEDDDEDGAGDRRALGGAAGHGQLEQGLRRRRGHGHVAAGRDLRRLADPRVHVLVDHVDDDRDADGRAALGQGERTRDVHEMRRVRRADVDRLRRVAGSRLVDLRVVGDPGLRRDREDVDDHRACDRRISTACAAADRDRRDGRQRDLRDLRVGDDRVDRRGRRDRERLRRIDDRPGADEGLCLDGR